MLNNKLNKIRVIALGAFLFTLAGCDTCGIEAKICEMQCDGKICEMKCAAEEKACTVKAAVKEKLE